MMKKVKRIVREVPQHWVGDGFPVRSLLSYSGGNEFDPFLLLDYAGPYEFGAGESKRGVGEYPHKGFETVTINGESVKAVELIQFERDGSHVIIESGSASRILALSGEPIGEPVAGQGPFVMNTPDEIGKAIQEYQAGRMGHLTQVARLFCE